MTSVDPERPSAGGDPNDDVVVGVDGSPSAAAALVWAGEEAAVRRRPLHVVTAWMAPVWPWDLFAGWPAGDPGPASDHATEVATAAARSISSTLGDGVRVDAQVVQDPAATALVEVSAPHGLLVLGDRGRGGFTSLLLGSVVLGCVHRSTVPVVVVRARAAGWPDGEVVVGVDGSEGSARALRWAAAEATAHGRRLRVIHAWDTSVAVPPGGIALAPWDDHVFIERTRQAVSRFVEETLDGVATKPAIEVEPVPALAPQALIEQSRRAALLVVGSRGRGGLAGLVLGSVSQQCLHHAGCPVAIVPGRPATEGAGSTST